MTSPSGLTSLVAMQFENVTASALANLDFDGKVVSHSLVQSDGTKVTLGLIYPGEYHFATEAAERMEITDGGCRVRLDGQSEWKAYHGGTAFEVPANSGFTIDVKEAICQYVCTFLSS